MAGVHTFNIPDQLSNLDQGIHDRLNGVQRDETNPDTCSPETLKRFADRFDGKAREIQLAKEGADAFLAAHPEFEDTTENANQLVATAKAVFGTAHPTREQLEHVYPRVVEQGLVTQNKKKLKEIADEKAKAAALEQASLTEEEMYTFDMNDARMVYEGSMTAGEARRRHIEARRANGVFG